MIYKVLILLTAFAFSSAWGQGSVKIGELNSYKVFPAFLEPYRKGMELAVEEINAAGGKGEVVIRDDGGTPGDAVRVAEELIARERVNLLMGTFASNVGLAVSNLAAQRKVLFLASEPLTDKIVWENGNRYTFRLRPSTYMQTAMLIPQAAKPGAIFSSLFAADLQKFVREGNTRGLFKDRPVFNLIAGEPEYLDTLKDETPEGWWVTGYPWSEINTPEHKAFRDAYQKRWKDYPRLGSVVGYSAVHAVASAVRAAKSAETEKLVEALEGLKM